MNKLADDFEVRHIRRALQRGKVLPAQPHYCPNCGATPQIEICPVQDCPRGYPMEIVGGRIDTDPRNKRGHLL